MKIRITDTPPEGRELEFEFAYEQPRPGETDERKGASANARLAPEYKFAEPISAKLHLSIEGSTVFVRGNAAGRFSTLCARCAESTAKPLAVDVDIVLKPAKPGARVDDQVEDLALGYYDDKVVDCANVVEEFLTLALPYTVLCSEDCAGLCPGCGANLNTSECSCTAEKEPDGPLGVLRQMKLH